MQVELLHCTPNPEVFIGKMAGICYGKETTDDETAIKRAVHCVSKGHLSTLRFAHVTFHISGISRICSHQIVRHGKFLDFLQRSQRYCNESDAEFVRPPKLTQIQEIIFYCAEKFVLNLYKLLLYTGMKKQDARFILLASTETELVITGAIQAWLNFVNTRDAKEAQWEIRAVAQEIKRQLNAVSPNIFRIETDAN